MIIKTVHVASLKRLRVRTNTKQLENNIIIIIIIIITFFTAI